VMRVLELELVSYADGVAALDLLVGSGTYVRSIADALGGHCVTLRRTEVGPFRVDEADEERVLSLEEALPRLAAVRAS
jgi:tRNA U55 pseudouridine synthase TruB